MWWDSSSERKLWQAVEHLDLYGEWNYWRLSTSLMQTQLKVNCVVSLVFFCFRCEGLYGLVRACVLSGVHPSHGYFEQCATWISTWEFAIPRNPSSTVFVHHETKRVLSTLRGFLKERIHSSMVSSVTLSQSHGGAGACVRYLID